MNVHSVSQGSAEWRALRAKYHTASEAPAMMGVSKYKTRTELLIAKKTGIVAEATPSQRVIFDKGHAAEALARRIIEEQIGEELYPLVGTLNNLLVSTDGITMTGDTLFEHKLFNKSLAAQMEAEDLEPNYYWQLEQQLLVSGAERVIFVCSDGTTEKFVSMEYRPVAGRADHLVEGWKQFDADLANFELPNAPSIVVGKAPEDLPALRIELAGMVTASNLKAFEQSALAVIDSVKTEMTTDQDFADAKKGVKWCSDVEEAIAAAKKQALSQTASIAELFSSMDRISNHARETRLKLDKLVKAQELLVKSSIKQKAEQALSDHISAINKTLGRVVLPPVSSDFLGVMKNKRTLSSLQDAMDTELARAKIEANKAADAIRINLTTLAEMAADHVFLFSDFQPLVVKDNDDLKNLIQLRISEHQKAESAQPSHHWAEHYVTPKEVQMRAEVFDMEALIKAVSIGQAPITLLEVNWAAIDALVEMQGTSFNVAGVRLVRKDSSGKTNSPGQTH